MCVQCVYNARAMCAHCTMPIYRASADCSPHRPLSTQRDISKIMGACGIFGICCTCTILPQIGLGTGGGYCLMRGAQQSSPNKESSAMENFMLAASAQGVTLICRSLNAKLRGDFV